MKLTPHIHFCLLEKLVCATESKLLVCFSGISVNCEETASWVCQTLDCVWVETVSPFYPSKHLVWPLHILVILTQFHLYFGLSSTMFQSATLNPQTTLLGSTVISPILGAEVTAVQKDPDLAQDHAANNGLSLSNPTPAPTP